jgi:hypothetical protein
MWRVCRAAGRPWPRLSDDDVIDYMVMEAVALKAKQQEEDAQKTDQRAQWKREQEKKLREMVR